MVLPQMLREENERRLKKQYWERQHRKIRGEDIYSLYCVWCNGFANEKAKTNARVFAKWLKNEKIELTQFQRKWLLENRFGFTLVWNEEKNDWEKKQ